MLFEISTLNHPFKNDMTTLRSTLLVLRELGTNGSKTRSTYNLELPIFRGNVFRLVVSLIRKLDLVQLENSMSELHRYPL